MAHEPRKIQKKIRKQQRTTVSRRGANKRSFQHEGYNYWAASDPYYFDSLPAEHIGKECWHLNPCNDRSYECVVGKGTGAALVNGLKYPKGHCVKKDKVNLGPISL